MSASLPPTLERLGIDVPEDEIEEYSVEIKATGRGHEYVSETTPEEGEEPVYIHRLAAVAWGVIDSLSDPWDIHHEIPEEWLLPEEIEAIERGQDGTLGVPWVTIEDGLDDREPESHRYGHIRPSPSPSERVAADGGEVDGK